MSDDGAIFRLGTNGYLTVIASFHGTNGWVPSAITVGPDSAFYGTVGFDSPDVSSGLFRATTNGEITTLVQFYHTNGLVAWSPPVVGPDGWLYGVTDSVYDGFGTIYRMSTNGEFAEIFTSGGTNGAGWKPRMTVGADGNLYGTAPGGGIGNGGTLFRITTNGTFTKLVDFKTVDSTIGVAPWAEMMLASDGYLYGSTTGAGPAGSGSIFKVSTNGEIAMVAPLFVTNGVAAAELVQAADGTIYGAAGYGGDTDAGTIFRLTPDGTIEKIADFSSIGQIEPSAPVFGPDGALYGITLYTDRMFSGSAYRVTANGELSVYARFSNPEGERPTTGLVMDKDGNLYGTTTKGGEWDFGSVFKLSPTGELTTLASFHESDGAYPNSTLLLARDGSLYGTTERGGSEDDGGVVFKITSNGVFSVVLQLTLATGMYPKPGLAQTTNGDIYVTTEMGGDGYYGTILRFDESDTLIRNIPFNVGNPGNPRAGLTLGRDGTLFGTTDFGGTNSYLGSFGQLFTSSRVFKMTSDNEVSTLASFENHEYPYQRPVLAEDGNLYGLISHLEGDWFSLQEVSSLYRVTMDGEITKLPPFYGSNAPSPFGELMQGADGYLYNVATGDEYRDCGAILRFSTNGALTKLLEFDGLNGCTPKSELVQAPDGTFYGTTARGGVGGGGVVFRLILRKITSIQVTNDSATLTVSGVPGETYVIQATTNLNSPVWENLGTTTAPESGVFQFQDVGLRKGERYYRVAVP